MAGIISLFILQKYSFETYQHLMCFYNYSKDLSFNLMDLAKIQKWVSNRKQHQSTQDILYTVMENHTIGHITLLFVMYHKVPFANRNLEQFVMEFQHHLTPQEANIYEPKSLQPSKYSGLFYVPKLGKLNDFDEFMNQIVVAKWTFPDGYHYKLEPPNTIVPNRKGGYIRLIQSTEWKVITQMWYTRSHITRTHLYQIIAYFEGHLPHQKSLH